MISSLNIHVALKQGKSYLKDAYVTQPFRIVPVGQYRNDSAAYLMTMSSSPGILDGDDYRISIQVDAQAQLQLQSQSYQRLYHMEGSAHQQMTIKLDDQAAFSYVPHPVVPHENASFYSTNTVHLSDDCDFILGEILTCGRKMSGEIFRYRHVQNLVEIFHKNRLIFKDNILLQPPSTNLSALGLFEGYTHQGMLCYINTHALPLQDLIESLSERYREIEGIAFGISELQCNGFAIRVLGYGGEQLYKIFQEVQSVIWDQYILPSKKTNTALLYSSNH
ncbi:urease accessory protein UreD [Flavobacterium sp. '19STA2R22 D10 B1']|uniref:urease accessory protein UreD n=1 Tax=Flavobacterium aerium TaxID=3037261 RepID=UPI00278BB83A|nr:urease accessory protein UreD [Flavobacterium sp. '19STA2R22 D10 B1']